jgi:hypothetical protein
VLAPAGDFPDRAIPLAGGSAHCTGRYGVTVAVQRRATAVDLATVITLAAVALFEITVTVGTYSVHDHLPVAVAAGLALCGALFWRRRHPLTVTVFALATMLVAFRLGVVPQAWLVPYLLVLAYSAGAHSRGWESIAGLVSTLLIAEVIAVHAADAPPAPSPSDYVFTATVCGVAWLAGYALRRRHEQASVELRAERAVPQRYAAARTSGCRNDGTPASKVISPAHSAGSRSGRYARTSVRPAGSPRDPRGPRRRLPTATPERVHRGLPVAGCPAAAAQRAGARTWRALATRHRQGRTS